MTLLPVCPCRWMKIYGEAFVWISTPLMTYETLFCIALLFGSRHVVGQFALT